MKRIRQLCIVAALLIILFFFHTSYSVFGQIDWHDKLKSQFSSLENNKTFHIALLLPWWYNIIMAKKLIHWDQNYANDDEKQIAKLDNKNSGIKALMRA